jgi:hypothetical protein
VLSGGEGPVAAARGVGALAALRSKQGKWPFAVKVLAGR